MDRNFALEFVRVSESAAMAAAQFMGHGNEKAADHAAVEAMRRAFDTIPFAGTVKIGEGERDEGHEGDEERHEAAAAASAEAAAPSHEHAAKMQCGMQWRRRRSSRSSRT